MIECPLQPLNNVTEVSLHWHIVDPGLQVAVEVLVVLGLLLENEGAPTH